MKSTLQTREIDVKFDWLRDQTERQRDREKGVEVEEVGRYFECVCVIIDSGAVSSRWFTWVFNLIYGIFVPFHAEQISFSVKFVGVRNGQTHSGHLPVTQKVPSWLPSSPSSSSPCSSSSSSSSPSSSFHFFSKLWNATNSPWKMQRNAAATYYKLCLYNTAIPWLTPSLSGNHRLAWLC